MSGSRRKAIKRTLVDAGVAPTKGKVRKAKRAYDGVDEEPIPQHDIYD